MSCDTAGDTKPAAQAQWGGVGVMKGDEGGAGQRNVNRDTTASLRRRVRGSRTTSVSLETKANS